MTGKVKPVKLLSIILMILKISLTLGLLILQDLEILKELKKTVKLLNHSKNFLNKFQKLIIFY
jgi:hypothetical protein